MRDIDIRRQGHAGRITLNRPNALNALTYDMLRAIGTALEDWQDDDAIRLILIDAAGPRAFCAGGDIADLYRTGTAGDYAFGRRFWRDEYRVNAQLANYPKPVVTFLQGFTMGGGVGIGCHAGLRIVGESSQIAMPECGIGLVPDVGGSLLLAKAPGRLGRYLGVSAARMGTGDAILAGFADRYLPEADWDAAKSALCDTGDVPGLNAMFQPPPHAPLSDHLDEIDRLFAANTLADMIDALQSAGTPITTGILKQIGRNSPLAMACAIEIQNRLDPDRSTIHAALDLEYRFTARAMEHGDFLEGIRAAIIDKDRKPRWRNTMDTVAPEQVAAMLAPLQEKDARP